MTDTDEMNKRIYEYALKHGLTDIENPEVFNDFSRFCMELYGIGLKQGASMARENDAEERARQKRMKNNLWQKSDTGDTKPQP